MSTAQNNVATERADRIIVPLSAVTIAINQGDFVKISSKVGVASSGSADSAIGIADETNPVASIGGGCNPGMAGAAAAIAVIPMTPYKGCAIMFLPITSLDSVGFWDAVYRTADSQVLTVTAGGGAIQVGRCVELTAFTGDGTARAKILLCGAN